MSPTVLLPIVAAVLAAPQEPASQPGAAAGAQEPIHIFSMSFGDLRECVKHPKDEGLRRAFAMLDDRIAELPAEFPEQIPPHLATALDPGTIPTWMRLLSAPKSIRMDLSPEALQYGAMPFQFGLAIHQDSPEEATLFQAELMSILQRMELPVPDDMIFREESSLVLGTGIMPEPMGATRAAALLGEGEPLIGEMRMDVGGYFQFIAAAMMQGGAPPEAAMIFDIVERMGLMDCVLEVASTADATHAREVAVMTNIGGRMRDAGLLPEGGLTAAHFAPVPADATWASVERFDMAAAFDALTALVSEILVEQTGAEIDVSEMIAATIGVDLRNGVFGALGDTYGMYASDTTGGGGVTSTVMFFSLRDADAFLETKEQLEELINGFAAMGANGYVSARTWARGDGEYTTLTFPGIPVPLEPTMAMTEEWLVIAATPQAALGAMGQIESGNAGLASHPGVAPLLAGGAKNAITFFDTAHYARSGYGTTSMLLSGVSNAVRSRVDELRDPGPIMPVYAEFSEGIAPTIGYGELVGDDYVNVSVGDASTVVQMAALTGFLYDYAALFIAPAMAAAAPEIMRDIGRNF